MAEITATEAKDLHSRTYTWEGATNGGTPDTFTPVLIERVPYSITVQASGTFGASAAIALHGSLDDTNYVALNDRAGTAISLTAAGLASAGDAVKYIKPVLTDGDGSTDIDVVALIRFDKS